MLGMYFDIYTQYKMGDVNPKLKPIWDYLLENKDKLFPKTFKYESENGTSDETKVLFGDMIARMERYVEDNFESAISRTSRTGAKTSVKVVMPSSPRYESHAFKRENPGMWL